MLVTAKATPLLQRPTPSDIAAPSLRLSAIVGLIAIAVSIAGSWVPSLWGDEAASVMSATRTLPSLWGMLAHVDAVHGAYYLGLHAWVGVAGSSPFAVRLPSAIAAGITAGGVVWLAQRFGSTQFAIGAGLLTALLPRLTYAGAEARAYAFDAALATLLCVTLVELVVSGRLSRRGWVAYGAVLTVGIYTFVYFGLMILVAAVVVLATGRLRAQWRRWAIATLVAVTASTPILLFAFLERGQVAFLAHRDVVNVDAVLVQMWFGSSAVAVAAGGLIILAVVCWVRDILRARGRGVPAGPSVEIIALPWLLLPMGLLIAISPLLAGYTARYGTLSAPAAALLMTAGVRRIGEVVRRRWVPVVAVIAVAACVVPVWVSQRTPYAKNGSDWNEIAATITAEAVRGDAIVFDEGVRPSRRPRLAMSTNPTSFSAVRDPTLKTPYAEGVSWHDVTYTVADAISSGRFAGVDRVWMVEYATASHVDTWGMADLAVAGYRQVRAIRGHRSVVYLYERAP
ncbi:MULTISPECIES: glycosyltransferase family 39 protein [Microbacterium]|uniref:Uncharacterized protein n=1 Tax=Microbacterium hominis TaxID=162426 RepID=A0A2K9DF52_9MICO|nr:MULTISPECIES: glycosyltransferase family 39 protein [Microbacterium]AUG28067.1 hypothetical protein CXR34_00385 [Microbacterium hominis]